MAFVSWNKNQNNDIINSNPSWYSRLKDFWNWVSIFYLVEKARLIDMNDSWFDGLTWYDMMWYDIDIWFMIYDMVFYILYFIMLLLHSSHQLHVARGLSLQDWQDCRRPAHWAVGFTSWIRRMVPRVQNMVPEIYLDC